MKKILQISVLFLIAALQFNAQGKRALSIEDLWAMKRIVDFDLSPDGTKLVFSVTEYRMESNKGNTDIWLINSDGSDLRPLKNSEEDETEPKFSPKGKKINYVLNNEIRQCDLDGSNDEQVTDIYTGASGLVWAKGGDKFLFKSKVYPECTTQECNEKKDKEKESSQIKAEIFTELMFRHWNKWRGSKISHLFMYNTEGKEYFDLNPGSKFDIPPLALGSSNDYSISPDGNEAAFTMNTSEFLTTSTNNDVFIMKISNIRELSEPVYKKISNSKGNDNQPVYSPDGKFIAFRSMAREGFEADKQALILYDRETGELRNLSDYLDISFGDLVWSPDSKFIYYNAENEIYKSIYRIEIQSGKNELLLKDGINSKLHLSGDGQTLFFKQQRAYLPDEIFSMDSDGNNLGQLTFLNANILTQIDMNAVETFWSDGAEGAKVQSILIKPPFFNPDKKYPLMFLIHGGPQGQWGDEFHYRWNYQMFAAPGYVVVAPNPRGSEGYGQKFVDEISLDWGGKVYTDLMNAYDYALENFNYIDKKNTFAAGASYGGYMINWIEGHTDRFNALVCHAGTFNLESMYGSTEELWFVEWELGGTPWENRKLYEKWSPHMYVQNFKTPMLVIHGANDFRVPEGQAFELFTSLQRMGVESKFLYFPDEYHWIVKPQNARLWWNTIYDWFKQYTY